MKAAADFASAVTHAIRAAAKAIPLDELDPSSRLPSVRLPGVAFLGNDLDYDPLRKDPRSIDGQQPPAWLAMDLADGRLYTSDKPPAEGLDLHVELRHNEGLVATAACRLEPPRPAGAPVPWEAAAAELLGRFRALEPSLDKRVRQILVNHLSEVYDFRARRSRGRPLGVWLEVMARVCRLARSAAIAQLVPPTDATRQPSSSPTRHVDDQPYMPVARSPPTQ